MCSFSLEAGSILSKSGFCRGLSGSLGAIAGSCLVLGGREAVARSMVCERGIDGGPLLDFRRGEEPKKLANPFDSRRRWEDIELTELAADSLLF